MMHLPLVSVVIPTYNSSETILSCINSVFSQTYNNIEIIVVDDGSTDTTIKLLSDLIIGHEEKIKLVTQVNAGPSCARNNGISHAKGEYIAFLDSDDYIHESMYEDLMHCIYNHHVIEKQVQLFAENKDLVLAGSLYSVGDKCYFSKSFSFIRKISLTGLMLKNSFVTSTVMCPRSILQKYKFDESKKYSEDYKLWLQLATLGKLCILQGEVLTKMNDKPLWGAKGLSSKLWMMEKGELDNFKFMYKHSYVSYPLFLVSSSFSLFKYLRRMFLQKLK